MTLRELRSEARALEAQYYYVSTCFDENVCSKCFYDEGRIFRISEAKAGTKLPPYHEDCRCVLCFEITDKDFATIQQEKLTKFIDTVLNGMNTMDCLTFAFACYKALLERVVSFRIEYNGLSADSLASMLSDKIEPMLGSVVFREYDRVLSNR